MFCVILFPFFKKKILKIVSIFLKINLENVGLVFGNRECFGFQGSLISSGVPKALGQLAQEFRNRNPNRSRVFSKMVCYLRSYSEKYLWKLYIIRRDRDFFTKRSSRNIKDHQRESRRFPSPPPESACPIPVRCRNHERSIHIVVVIFDLLFLQRGT